MSAVLDPLTSYAIEDLKSCSAAQLKPTIQSYDCSEEFSFTRLVRIHELLEVEDEVVNRCIFDDECLHVA